MLFEPTPARIKRSQMSQFMAWLRDNDIVDVTSYDELHSWSVRDLPAFWSALARWDGVIWHKRPEATLLVGEGAEGASFFPGAELNYVDHAIRHHRLAPAIIALDEAGNRRSLTYGELANLGGAIAAGLRTLGVGKGDRVAAVLPNGIEAVAAFIATASLGAIWSSCAPEFGAPSMADRFRQISPTVLLVADGYRYGGKEYPLGEKTAELVAALPDLAAVVEVPQLAGSNATGGSSGTFHRDGVHQQSPARLSWAELAAKYEQLSPLPVAFDHPLWILYSSGTTGLPKAIVHSHGGILLEHLKSARLHSDFGPEERAFWYSTTGWMMWNFLVGGLLTGAAIVCYDGSAAYPHQMALWEMAAREAVTYFGTSAPFIEACRKAELSPRTKLDLSALHTIGSTGAPLPAEGFAWARGEIGDDVLVASVSGGTDVCTAFLHSCPLLPVYAGEMQCAALGCDAQAFGPDGEPVIGEVGELVITTPMPSMPVSLWGDYDGTRLHSTYFSQYRGIWRHGDWVRRTERDTFVIYGRSDATLNRGGVRMGTSEFYRIVEALVEVTDSLVVDTTGLGREGALVLFVVPKAGVDTKALQESVRTTLRERLSPRHVPDHVLITADLPRTLNGKRVEVPIRRILLGTSPTDALSRDSLANPGALDAVLQELEAAGLLSSLTTEAGRASTEVSPSSSEDR
ncbi:MAG: acetoacetate--CoA ligase [Acidimicrobiales bacterium]